MLCWEVYNQAKSLNCRPSDLYNIEWPLARFYFDRTIYWWGNYVDRKVKEAEHVMRERLRKARGNIEAFVTSSRIATFNKIMGLSVAEAYAKPVATQDFTKKKKTEKPTTTSGFGNGRMFGG